MTTKASIPTSLLITLCFLSLLQGTAFSAKKEVCIAGKGKVCQQPSKTNNAGAPNPNAYRINGPTSLNVPNTFTLTTSGGLGGGSDSYISTTLAVCDFNSSPSPSSSGEVRTKAPGTCTIVATKAAADGYGSATDQISFEVTAQSNGALGGSESNVSTPPNADNTTPNPVSNAAAPAPVNQTTPVTLTSSATNFISGGTVTLTISGGNGTGAYDLTGTGTCTVTSAGGSNQATLTGTNTTASATNCTIKARRLESPGFLTSSYSAPVNITINPPACSSDSASINTPVVDNNSRHVTISGTVPNCIGTIHFYQQASGDPTETWNYNPVQFAVSNGSFNQIITRSDGGPLAAKTWNMNLCFRTAPIPSGYQVGQCRTVTFTVTAPQIAGCSGNITPPAPDFVWVETTYDDGSGNISNVYWPQLRNIFSPPEGVSWVHVEADFGGNSNWSRLIQASKYIPSFGYEINYNDSPVDLSEMATPPPGSNLRLVYEAPYPNCDVGIATPGEMAPIPSLP